MKKWLIMALCLLPVSVWAADSHTTNTWQLDQSRSAVNFISIKKGHVGEVHHFDRLSGEVTNTTAKLQIDLTSVNTGIAIRNKRMQEHLFNTKKFTTVDVNVTFDAALLSIPKGTMKRITQELELNLHGISKKIHASLLVIAMDDGMFITTAEPVLIQASDFDLTSGIEQLRNLAKLPSIATSVPVTLQLYFVR